MNLSRRSRLSLCQFLDLFDRDSLVVLFEKHGLQTDDLSNQWGGTSVTAAVRGAVLAASGDDEGTSAPEPQPAAADTLLEDAPWGNAPEDGGTDPAPAETLQPMNARVQSVVESIDAPAVAERRAAALASNVNADATPSVEREQVLAPPRGNGHDNKAELLEIPAFLRRG